MRLRTVGFALAITSLTACGNGPWPQVTSTIGLLALATGTVLHLWPETGAPPTVDVAPAAFQEGNLTWLGHSGFLVVMGGKTVLIDPYLEPGDGGVTRFARRVGQPADLSDMPRLDAVLITHNHHDHRHRPTLIALASRFPGAMLVVPRGGRPTEPNFANTQSLAPGESIEIGGLTIDAVRSRHGGPIRVEHGRISRGPAQAYVLRSVATSLFASGDTPLDPSLVEVGERFGPFDLALVPIAASEPARLLSHSHATPSDAVDLAVALRARRALPHHWGMIMFSPPSPAESLARFRAAAEGRVDIVVPPVGGTVSIRQPLL